MAAKTPHRFHNDPKVQRPGLRRASAMTCIWR